MNVLQSFILIAQRLWEPFGVLLLAGILFALWRNWKTRGPLFWFAAASLAAALLWRAFLPGVTTSRYYSIFALPCIFFTAYLLLRLPLSRKISWIALGILGFAAICKDMRFNPYERKLLDLYEVVKKDAARHERPLLFSCSRFARQERYYVGIPNCAPDHVVGWEAILEGLRGNLDVYRGDFDAVYVFLELPGELENPELILKRLMPNGIELLGDVWRNSRKRKRIVAFRYSPPPCEEPMRLDETCASELVKNGDFSKILPEEQKNALLKNWKRYLPRYRSEKAELPEDWKCEYSLFGETDAFIAIRKESGRNVLHVVANDFYIAPTSPGIPHKNSAALSFRVRANRDSVLQISQRGDPIVVIPMKKGSERVYRAILPKRKDSPPQTNVRFWLQHGDIDLWDVRWEPIDPATDFFQEIESSDGFPGVSSSKPAMSGDSSCAFSTTFLDFIEPAA